MCDDNAELSRLLAQTKPASPVSIHTDVKSVLVAHATNFSTGKLSTERLLEVVFSPFLRLASKENQAETSASRLESDKALQLREIMTSAWFEAVQTTLYGPGDDDPCVVMALLNREKKLELKRELEKSSFVQVCMR